ncbi:MAG TPA: glutaminyl-peptide cyclotransferase [Bryobacteraceae bacterium]|nr:glutaminyl-peptide cyclotransferase [Bryobacteraceae bacterium]
MRMMIVAAALAACACGPATEAGGIPEWGYEVVHTYPHDKLAFTEGLFYYNGFLYESTGVEEQSSVRKVKLETGEVVQKRDLPSQYFGEGIVAWKGRLIQMTYKTEVGFIFDFNTFEKKSEFHYTGQGWAFTTDGKKIYMDGSRIVGAEESDPEIRIWDPETLKETGVIHVTADGQPVPNLNELEWVKGEIYANIWMTNRIARIDPASGKVVGWIDLTGLLTPSDRVEDGSFPTDVLNGIAYDAEHDRLFVTGKRWPKLFEIRLVKKGG